MRSAALLVLPAALLVASAARADDPPPVVVRYPPSSVRPKMIIGGLAIAGIAYASGYLVAVGTPAVPGSEALKVPVVGPWVALAQNNCAPGNPTCGASIYGRGALLVLEGLVQIAGLGLAGEGLFMTTEGSAPKPAQVGWSAGGITFQPTPLVTARVTGLGITGTF
jgi:hypothetical protein